MKMESGVFFILSNIADVFPLSPFLLLIWTETSMGLLAQPDKKSAIPEWHSPF